MDNKLQQYFPMIRTKREIMEKIENDESLRMVFYHWTEEQRREFLDFCTGVRGVKIMYDFAGREILNPEYNPERVEEFLSLLLGQKVQIVEVLPGDSTRIADEASLVIMDIVVQLGDGSIANLEIQKIGYKFFCKNIFSFLLTSSAKLSTIKTVKSKLKTGWMHGWPL